MNVNVSRKKIAIFIAVLVVIALGAKWVKDGAPERAEKATVQLMIKYAQKQALEIAIIEQASKLADYRQQLAAAKEKSIKTGMEHLNNKLVIPEPIAEPDDTE